MTIRVAGILHETTADMPGLATSIFAQGCRHHCRKCHNPQTWDFAGGKDYTIDELLDIVISDEFCDVVFSGGDPMFQVEAFTELAKMIKSRTNKAIWCYSGYTYEEIRDNATMRLILPFLDVLVDGRYIDSQRNTSLRFRGSENQRIVHLKDGEIDWIE